MTSRAEQGPLQIGARFLDKYEIVGQLGRGGQAWVYVGTHIFTGREVAIKVIHSAYGVTREMTIRAKSEARALGKLDHPNIVVMHDAGVTEEGLFYIVMELLRGRTFRAVLAAHGHLEVEEVLRLAIQAGEAVHAAHQVQMVHRDLKPDNIYLTRDNRLKVLDFGIAKMLDEIGFTTRKDVVAGTLLYMSPEQAQGLPLTAKSDICALGLMMFEALIGKHPTLLVFERDLAARNEPYRRATIADIPPIQVNRMPPMLSDLDRSIPIYVAQVVQRAIAKVAKQRFATMADLVAAMRLCLETYLRETPAAHRPPSVRDLSVPAPKVEETTPAAEEVALGSQRTAEMSPAPAPTPESERPAQPLLGAVTAPVGTRVSSQSPSTQAKLTRDASADSQPALVTRKAKPSQSMARPQAAAVWARESETHPPVAVARRRDVAVAATVRSTAYHAVRNTIAAGALFGAAVGAISAQIYLGAESRSAAVVAASPVTPTPLPAQAITPSAASTPSEPIASSTSLPTSDAPAPSPQTVLTHPDRPTPQPTSGAKPIAPKQPHPPQRTPGSKNTSRATQASAEPAGEAATPKPAAHKRAIYGD